MPKHAVSNVCSRELLFSIHFEKDIRKNIIFIKDCEQQQTIYERPINDRKKNDDNFVSIR